ncbi:MAG: hypothetical protein K6E19_03320 [Lachnospiraceae bacterium]|nr:hypothetical protein [Lachnospiraceae bacterium]
MTDNEILEKETENTVTEEVKETAPETADAGTETEPVVVKNFTKIVIPVAAVVLVIAAVIAVVLLLPGNRAKRYTGTANKAYAAGNFDKAISFYQKALGFDDNAYIALKGAILSAAASGNTELRDELSHEAIYSIADRGTYITEKEKVNAIELALTAYEYLTNYLADGDLLWIRLNTVYEKLGEPGELRPMLAGYAFGRGKAIIAADGDPFLALSMFDSATKFSDGSEPVAEEAETAILKIIESNIRTDNFDEARNILSTWGEKYSISNRDSILKDINLKEDLYETKLSFMTRVYENMYSCFNGLKDSFAESVASSTQGLDIRMLTYDWFEMQNLDGSEDADKLALAALKNQAVDDGPVIFSPEGFTAKGEEIACGLYSYGDLILQDDGSVNTSYYFFIGNYVDGKREGYGISFVRTGETSFYCFEGIWHDDAPNGYGVLYRKNNYAHTQLAEYTDILFGNYVNGYQDGTVLARISTNEQPGTYYEGTYEVKDGYGVEVPIKTEDYEILNPIPEDYVLIGVIPNITDGYSNYMIYRDKRSEKKGTIGYN